MRYNHRLSINISTLPSKPWNAGSLRSSFWLLRCPCLATPVQGCSIEPRPSNTSKHIKLQMISFTPLIIPCSPILVFVITRALRLGANCESMSTPCHQQWRVVAWPFWPSCLTPFLCPSCPWCHSQPAWQVWPFRKALAWSHHQSCPLLSIR